MRTKHVVVRTYDSSWVLAFREIETYIRKKIPNNYRIEHVGSTSVEGLSAKPVIDIDILYQSKEAFSFLLHTLEELGYVHEGELGIPNRHAFRYRDLPFMKHHLYLVKKGCKAHLDHVYLRDYLREHKEDRNKYGALKEALAKTFPYDIDAYMDGKSPLIEEILSRAYDWSMKKDR